MAVCLAFQGTLLHTPEQPGIVEVLSDHIIIVNDRGIIVHLGPAGGAGGALQAAAIDPAAVRVLNQQQYQYCGVGTDLPLLGDNGWLKTYAFPTEASFSNTSHAQHIYSKCVQRLLRLGTTTANYFTTLHVDACKVLADVVQQLGQRAVIGKVCMDQHSPEEYTENGAAESAKGAAEVVQYIQGLGCSRLYPAVIPRFIPTCSQELLSSLGALARRHSLHIHSHIAESCDQVEFSRKLHPNHDNDAEVYDAAGLLTDKAIYAHGTQLTEDAMALMAAKGAAVAHCPLSNFYFGDGLFDVVKALSMGVKVGLGTDIAGGYSPSMLQAQRMAVINSHALKAATLMYGGGKQQEQQQQQGTTEQQQQQQVQGTGEASSSAAVAAPSNSGRAAATAAITNPAVSAAAAAHMLTWEDALWLATAGGAAALGLQDTVGRFAVGMEFDALLVDAGAAAAGGAVFDVMQRGNDPLVLLEHFVNNGDDRNIVEVYVAGRRCV